jgi:hypothetical protein
MVAVPDNGTPDPREEPGDAPPAPEDDQSCLLFGGSAGVSSGVYRPRAYQLRLRSENIVQHHVTHLHEIHHKVLNDDTAWGSLIHIAARHDDWDGLLALFIANSRLVHEAFASFMAVSLAQQRHENVDLVLDEYPVYHPLVNRIRRLLAPVPAGHRQDLAATGIARFCMSSPVLDLAAERYPDQITLSEIPSSWLPDQRFSVIGRVGAQSVGDARIAADNAFAEVEGRSFEALGLDETDDRLDSAWALSSGGPARRRQQAARLRTAYRDLRKGREGARTTRDHCNTAGTPYQDRYGKAGSPN